jgi:hypothetical protein
MTLVAPDAGQLARMRQHVRPGVKFFSERFGGRPYDNCMIDSAMGPLAWMGKNVQDGDDDAIRYFTGVDDPAGLGFADVRTALSALYPGEAWHVGLASWDFIAAQIKRHGRSGRYLAQFTIALDMSKMPDELRKWCGLSYDGGHAVRLISRDRHDDTRYYMYDVMQPTDLPAGEDPSTWLPGAWVDRDVLDAAAFKRSGLVEVTYAYKNGYAGPVFAK